MTLMHKENKRCGLCGSEGEFDVVMSTNTFGSPDLDTRPPEMQRSTIFAWVQRCPACGYCASDVSAARPRASSVVAGKEYKQQLDNPEYPELANSFVCSGILDRESEDYAAATWAFIGAAWVCDDADHPEQAVKCRQDAADMLVRAEGSDQQITGQEGASTAILVDLLRRAGRMEEARKAIEKRRFGITEEVITRILDYQAALIEKGDTSCYTIAQALGEHA